MTGRVAFVGPLPPPVNGFYIICSRMLSLLQERGETHVFNRAPIPGQRLRTLLSQLLRQPLYFFGLCLLRRRVTIYLALSGGSGQWVDLIYAAVARLFRRPIYVHHHSYAYINAPTGISRSLFRLVRDATHIVLSDKMGARLAAAYSLKPGGVRVISNSAFYESAEGEVSRTSVETSPVGIGFLSNITFEKGFVEFFAILQRLKGDGVPYRAYIAGPIAPPARARFEELMACASDVNYVGPVYGVEKDRFYDRLDFFVFPTMYLNEAEPLVIYEALRAGVHVIACDRGSIAELLSNGGGLALGRHDIVESGARRIGELSSNRVALLEARRMSLLQAQRIRRSSGRVLEEVLNSLQHNVSAGHFKGHV